MKRIISVFGFVALATLAISAQPSFSAPDLLNVRRVADPQVSPDGSTVAFVKVTVNAQRTGYDTSINELVLQERPEALCLECSIFNMSESLFDAVRDDERHADLPVVIISDTPDIAVDSLRKRRARRVRIVPKPFSGSDVVRALEELFEVQNAPAEGGRA